MKVLFLLEIVPWKSTITIGIIIVWVIVYEYVERYREYLESQGVNIVEARLISYDELYELGCRGVSCADTSPWVHSTSYWTGSAYNNSFMYVVYSKGSFTNDSLSTVSVYGVRPVIKVSKTFF